MLSNKTPQTQWCTRQAWGCLANVCRAAVFGWSRWGLAPGRSWAQVCSTCLLYLWGQKAKLGCVLPPRAGAQEQACPCKHISAGFWVMFISLHWLKQTPWPLPDSRGNIDSTSQWEELQNSSEFQGRVKNWVDFCDQPNPASSTRDE